MTTCWIIQVCKYSTHCHCWIWWTGTPTGGDRWASTLTGGDWWASTLTGRTHHTYVFVLFLIHFIFLVNNQRVISNDFVSEDFYWHYTRYYYRRVTPKVDVRIVIAVTISIISVCQYYVAWSNYKSAMSYLVQIPKYRSRAKEIAIKEKLLETDKKKLRGRSKVRRPLQSGALDGQCKISA